jgi:hypothetical protein
MTLEETVDALRIARAAREYVLRSEEMAKLLVESEKPLDPKIELRTGEAWARLLEAVKAPKTGLPPLEKKRAAGEKAARVNNNSPTSADSITTAAAGQARGRSCLMETPLARYVRRRLQSALMK